MSPHWHCLVPWSGWRGQGRQEWAYWSQWVTRAANIGHYLWPWHGYCVLWKKLLFSWSLGSDCSLTVSGSQSWALGWFSWRTWILHWTLNGGQNLFITQMLTKISFKSNILFIYVGPEILLLCKKSLFNHALCKNKAKGIISCANRWDICPCGFIFWSKM